MLEIYAAYGNVRHEPRFMTGVIFFVAGAQLNVADLVADAVLIERGGKKKPRSGLSLPARAIEDVSD